VEESNCFATESGARSFGNVCALDVVYEDCFEPQPILGKQAVTDHMLAKVAQRKGKGNVRIDRISDGDKACGFAWTWITNDNEVEGLRGTTFVELNDQTGEIQYIREIPEPIYKPGDLTLELLKAVTAGAERKPPKEYTQQTPTVANEVAKYLFLQVQGSSVDESMRMFDDSIQYRDFNYEDLLVGKDEVRKFIEDFNFPGIEFRPQRFDDGQDATCFTWEVVLEGAPETIKGMSYYELSPETRKVQYIRDVPESAIKPPILGKLARQLRPGKIYVIARRVFVFLVKVVVVIVPYPSSYLLELLETPTNPRPWCISRCQGRQQTWRKVEPVYFFRKCSETNNDMLTTIYIAS